MGNTLKAPQADIEVPVRRRAAIFTIETPEGSATISALQFFEGMFRPAPVHIYDPAAERAEFEAAVARARAAQNPELL